MKKIKEGIFVEEASTNVGVVNLDEKTYIIDTGSNTKLAKNLLSELENKEKIVLNTHSHADHIQGNKILEKNGAKIYASKLEVPFIQNPDLESFFLYGATPPKALRLSFYKAKPSHANSFDELFLPKNMELISLPGHSLGMTAIKIEDVIFCGDAYFGENIIEKYSYPYLTDVKKFLESLEKLEKTNANIYVPSHGEITNDPHKDIEKTKVALHTFVNATYKLVDKPKSAENICFELSKKMNVSLNTGTFYLFKSFLNAILTYLEERKEISQIAPGMWAKLPTV